MPEQRSSSEGPAEAARRLLEYLAEGLVDEPEEVSVEQFEGDDGTIVLELCVAATGEGCHVLVDIVD